MSKKIAAGAVGGLIGGLAFDALMRVLPGAAGQASMIAFAADAVHASNPLFGWLGYPLYGVVIGAVFGWLFRDQTLDAISAALWGGLYGVGWWIVAGLLLVPALLAVWPFSASAVERVRGVALPLLAGHVLYGVILGLAWSRITSRMSRRQRPGAVDHTARRAA